MSMTSTVAGPAQLVLLGAFALDVELDAESLHDSGFVVAQRKLVSHLNQMSDAHNSSADPLWAFSEMTEQAILLAPPGFANRPMLPMAFLRFESEQVTAQVAAHLRSIVASEWNIISCSLSFFTFGYATIRLDLRHRTDDAVIREAAIIEEFSQNLAESLGDALNPVRLSYESAARTVIPQLVVPPLTSNERHAGLLWLHRILIWHSDDLASMADEAEATVPNVHEILKFRDLIIVPGVDTSVICIKLGHKEPPDWVIQIFEFADVMYACLLQMDTWLFDQLNHVVLTTRAFGPVTAAKVVRDAQSSFERVELHRAKIDTAVGLLGSASIAIWQARSRMAGMPHLDASLTRKLELLSRLAQARHGAAELAHSSRLNRLALIFTFFSVASSGIALISFAYGGAWLSPSESRILVLIGVFLAVVVVTLLTIREMQFHVNIRRFHKAREMNTPSSDRQQALLRGPPGSTP